MDRTVLTFLDYNSYMDRTVHTFLGCSASMNGAAHIICVVKFKYGASGIHDS